MAPVLIGVAGGTASGKSSVCKALGRHFENKSVTVIPLSFYYHPLTADQQKDIRNYNFDQPEAINFELLTDHLKKLRNGVGVEIPVYNELDNKTNHKFIEPADVVVTEGIFVFYTDELRSLFDLKIYVHADVDERLSRRLLRDVREKGRTMEAVLERYHTFIKPCHEMYVHPTKQYADLVIINHDQPGVACPIPSAAVECLIRHIQLHLDKDAPLPHLAEQPPHSPTS
eukprot:TRINITY_DN67298_c0_g1_i1.p1 TRINITY_DN67298_c0_g1~~TRINITY_DN67298_c0_g1_i1.p1  ORF type:complete len:236 (-),score=54.19 TRINITY_DN67298_c0_g1_i1:206-889(-)